ncbi:MAG: hypothetical protein JWM04_1660 [Verrucomicrobiales bacterium]|nr:hypothetical protein [Verrucomicrobiales bacterium]
MQHIRLYFNLLIIGIAITQTGCRKSETHPPSTPPVATPAGTAKELFEQTLKDYHLASAEAAEPKKSALLKKAEDGYRQVIHYFPKDAQWAAQAQRSLGNVQAEQGHWEEAVQSYAQVEKDYPKQEWEILQSWKSAADLLWDKDQKAKSQEYYRKIINTYDGKDVGAVFGIIVKASKKRLE